MDGLEEFEKTLAAEKAAEAAAQAKSSGKDRKHRHRHHRSHHHRSRDEEDDEHDRHRHKRSKRSEEDDDEGSRERHHRRSKHSKYDDQQEHERRHRKSTKVSDPKEDLPLPDEEHAPSLAKETSRSKRDSWMTAPSSLEIDYVQKPIQTKPEERTSAKKPDYDLKIHKNELNLHLQDLASGKSLEEVGDDGEEVEYTFGDEGAQWRMTKLKAVYKQAEDTGKSVEEVAIAVSRILTLDFDMSLLTFTIALRRPTPF